VRRRFAASQPVLPVPICSVNLSLAFSRLDGAVDSVLDCLECGAESTPLGTRRNRLALTVAAPPPASDARRRRIHKSLAVFADADRSIDGAVHVLPNPRPSRSGCGPNQRAAT